MTKPNLQVLQGGKANTPTQQRDPYPFYEGFIAQLTTALCSRPALYSVVGEPLDEERMPNEHARLALRAARSVFRDTGNGPAGVVVVLQRLHQWKADGKVTAKDIAAVDSLFEEAEAEGILNDEQIVCSVVPVLKRSKQREAIEAATREFVQPGGNPERALQVLEEIARIGQREQRVGNVFGGSALEMVRSSLDVPRLPTLIPEVDDLIDDGIERGCECIWMAPTGGGKSMALINAAIGGIVFQQHVAYATLELSEERVLARMIAAATNVAVNDVLNRNGDVYTLEAIEGALREIGAGRWGRLYTRKFTPRATTPADLLEWVRQIEQVRGDVITLLVVDYVDKLSPNKEKKTDSSYTAQERACEELREWAEANKSWVHTASQTKRGTTKRTKNEHLIDVDDIADSLGKARVTDYLISINPNTERTEAELFFAKVRNGEGRQRVGPLPTDFAYGRLFTPMLPPDFPTIVAKAGLR